MGTPPTILPAHAKLVKSTTWNKYPPAVYNMQWTDTPSANTVKAYFVDYKSISSQGRNVPFVDIPARPEADFLFTGELIGCSLIVVRRGDGLRVYHDSRYSSSALYDNVVMAVDFRDYAEEYTDPTMRKIDPATACMQFKSGQWTLYLQFLGENTQPIDQVPRGGVPEGKRIQRFRNVGGPRDRPFISRTRYDAVDIEQERESLYQKLKEVAVDYLGEESIPATQDSLFQDFPSTGPPSMNNPAVARTEALRQAMLDLDLENMIKRRVDLKRQEAERQKERPGMTSPWSDPRLTRHLNGD